VTFLFARY